MPMRRQLGNNSNATGCRQPHFWTIAARMIAVAAACLGFGRYVAGNPPAAPGPTATTPTLVHKVLEDFELSPWLPSPWSSAKGRTSLVSEPAPDVRTALSLKIDVAFSGKGFEHFTAEPPAASWIPGDAKSVTLRCKVSDSHYGAKVNFIDGWGRDRVNGTYLAWDIRSDPSGAWKTATFKLPEEWIRPLRISGISTHNWEAQQVKTRIQIQVDDIEIDTDIRNVDPKSGVLTTWKPEPSPADPSKALKECPRTPLVAVDMSSGQESNVFTRSDPEVRIRLQNWTPGVLTGKLTGRLLDASGRETDRFERGLEVDSSASLSSLLKAPRFGLYTLLASLSLSDGSERSQRMTIARLPADRELSEGQKLASPYGLNVHSGDKVVLLPFRKAGIVWFREYAFSYDWLVRARGDDGRYSGWPNYPKIVSAYLAAGGKCLPVLQKSIERPRVLDGHAAGRIGPDRRWTKEVCSIINAFPEVTHWELNNEYDLPAETYKAEEQIDWANYRAYHRQFAGILDLLGGGELVAVENGRAGIWPRRVLRCVQSGDFARIAVVNSHHYCGADPPETNLSNFNMGSEDQLPSLLFDGLRAVKRAAQADGKPRQSWLTEFGWDTLAGPVVSPYQQAVYLPREWMMAMAAGTDKAFWFYNFDAADPKQFFDGCGLLTAQGEPKLALCSMAGLTSVLPVPAYVGDLDAGPNTCGYVFRNEGKLVASLWTIEGDAGPSVQFRAQRLQDYLGNPLEGHSVRLTMAPVYAVGLSKSDAWYKQTAYGLETPRLMPAAAGDSLRLRVRVSNQRDEPITGQLKLVLPKGWTTEAADVPVRVLPGEAQDVELPFTIASAESVGLKEVAILACEDNPLKRMIVKVLVQSPLTVQVAPIAGRPGETQVTVDVGNRSARTLNGVLRMQLPDSWKALTPEIQIAELKPQEVRPVVCKFRWSADWRPSEAARIELDFGAGNRAARSLIPNQYAIHRAGKITIDGRLDDWGPATRLPPWMLGSSVGDSRAEVHLAWAKEGIYGAVVVRDSKVQVQDPKSFWAGDVLEMFLDTADDKRPRSAIQGDHQFWMVPLPEANRVYLGQWKMNQEIPATRYDIPAIRGAAMRTPEGYTMEFLLPAEQIQNYHPQAGSRLGLSVNLTIQGRQVSREAYWPSSKKSGATAHPDRWGTVLLLDE